VQKILVVLQISISLILIISTFLLYRQSSDLLNADYGFSIKDVVTVDLADISYELLLQEVAINPVLRKFQQNQAYRVANVHLAQSNQAAILENLESVWKQLEPVVPFNYRFYQDEIDAVYTDFMELVFLVRCLAVLAILIACFGMLGMSHYDTQARTKEIGVRKVFSANAKDVVLLLTTDLAKIIAVGITIGIPLAIYLNSLWLQVFANKTGFSVCLMVGATALTIALTFISIGWQTYSAALMNPVKSLRTE
jgi:putative ABC transport system permease protein